MGRASRKRPANGPQGAESLSPSRPEIKGASPTGCLGRSSRAQGSGSEAGPLPARAPKFNRNVTFNPDVKSGRLDFLQVQPPGLALVMAGELLEPAAGMLILGGDRGGTAFLGLLVEETHVVHGGLKARACARFPYLSALAARIA